MLRISGGSTIKCTHFRFGYMMCVVESVHDNNEMMIYLHTLTFIYVYMLIFMNQMKVKSWKIYFVNPNWIAVIPRQVAKKKRNESDLNFQLVLRHPAVHRQDFCYIKIDYTKNKIMMRDERVCFW